MISVSYTHLKDALGGENVYSALDHAIYTENVCIVTDEGDTAAYGILDKCVNAADRHVISYRASQRWLDGNGPVYMKNRNEDIYLLILVIFTAVQMCIRDRFFCDDMFQSLIFRQHCFFCNFDF